MPRNPHSRRRTPARAIRPFPILISVIPVALCLLALGCGREPARRADSVLSPAVPLVETPPILEEVVVQILPGVNPGAIWSAYNLTVEEVLPDGVTYRARLAGGGNVEGTVQLLQTDPRVASAETNGEVNAPTFQQSALAFNEGDLVPGDVYDQSMTTRLGLRLAHTGSRGRGIRVAILDTGADCDHPALARHILPESYDFVDADSDPSEAPCNLDSDGDGLLDEALGHGSAVAGLVAIVAPAADLLILRVLDSDGRGKAYTVARAIEYAADHGARVVNLSISVNRKVMSLDAAIRYARDKGVILVTSAGNVPGIVTPQYPASDARVWPVGSVDKESFVSSFSSLFPQVVLSAPGENLLSTSWNGGYSVWTGTSMAAPLVAGSAALVLRQRDGASQAQVLTRLQQTAGNIIGCGYGAGAGIVNPGRAVGSVGSLTGAGREAPAGGTPAR